MDNDMSSYFEDPDFKEALAKYEGMVEDHTPIYLDADELVDIAEYYTSIGKHKDAEKVVDFAIQLHPCNTDVLIFKARSLAIHGNLEEANQIAELIEDQTDREVQFLKADLLMYEERMEEADAILRQLAEDEEYELDTLLDIIQDYTDANQRKYATKWWNKTQKRFNIKALTKKNQKLRDILCDYYALVNQPELAVPLLQITLDEYPYSIRHWNELGKFHIQLGNFEAAQEALDFAFAIDENNADTSALKAYCFMQLDNKEEILKMYLKQAETSGDIVNPYRALTKIQMEMNDHKAAITYLEKLLDNQSKLTKEDCAEVYCDAAVCYATLGQYDKSHKYITKGIKLNKNAAGPRIAAGRCLLIRYQHTEDEQDKEEILNQVIRTFEYAFLFSRKDERMSTLLNIGAAYFDAHCFLYAIRYFEILNEEFPNMLHYTFLFLIYCYFYTQQTEKFLRCLAKTKRDYPNLFRQLEAESSRLSDVFFNKILREVISNINKGKIDLNNYL